MDTARISALLAPFLDHVVPHVRGPQTTRFSPVGAEVSRFLRRGGLLSPLQLAQISTYIDLLLRWNQRINLTAVRDPESIVTRHFGESFFLARHLLPAPCDRPSLEVVDIGSGAGFPGLPLKIWAPNIQLTLVESNHKKAAFLREVCRALTLTDVNVIAGRAESLIGHIPPADLVTFRAVEHFEDILPLASRFLAPSGRLALLIGASQISTLITLTPHLSWLPPIQLPRSESRVIAISSLLA